MIHSNSNILLVIYFAYTKQAKHINWYREVYSSFDIVFYAEDDNIVDKNEYDDNINWINLSIKNNYEKNNDWFMHKCLLDCIPKHNYTGYVFMADDVLFRYWKFNNLSIDKFWITRPYRPLPLNYILSNPGLSRSIGRIPRSNLKNFLDNSSKEYRNNIKSHFKDETTFIQLVNNDFVYIPGQFASEWYKCCLEMDKHDLQFVTCIFNSVFGSCKPKDITYITGDYSYRINKNNHINHPVKFSKEKHRIIFENEIKKNEKDICNT
jgi:hypothetical protein